MLTRTSANQFTPSRNVFVVTFIFTYFRSVLHFEISYKGRKFSMYFSPSFATDYILNRHAIIKPQTLKNFTKTNKEEFRQVLY